MNPLEQLLSLPADERAQRGLAHTPAEIAQQPDTWIETAALIRAAAPALRAFVAGVPRLVFSGAGTSHFIGLSLAGLYRRRGIQAEAVASTEIVADPEEALPPGPFGLVSFARSGNSPEGNQALRLARRLRGGAPGFAHLAITCNPDGELYRLAAGDTRLLLPPQTNDRGLAMTSSYTSMVIAGQGLASLADLADLAGYEAHVAALAGAARRVLSDAPGLLAAVAARKPGRALFLGTGTLLGAAIESHLKVQEMTGGRVVGKAESFLGLRHGPMALIDDRTLVVAYVSSDAARRRYEVDVLKELKAKRLGLFTLVVADCAQGLQPLADAVLETGCQAPDDLLPPVCVTVAQMLALFLALEAGLTPDTPSDGVINRVVQGVRIYDEVAEG